MNPIKGTGIIVCKTGIQSATTQKIRKMPITKKIKRKIQLSVTPKALYINSKYQMIKVIPCEIEMT